MNLLKETLDYLARHGKSSADVLWCGNSEFKFDWTTFTHLANQEYDEGHGVNEVSMDLKVVGKDFWLERHEYDGSEWWEFKQQPTEPANTRIPETLFGGWNSVYDKK